jgi:Domain of unknown function (DUF4962)/Heparinase II/III-like protein
MTTLCAALLALTCAAADTGVAPVPDQAPRINQLAHSPAHGSEAAVNPPPFIWVPPRHDLTYVLEVSQQSDFADPDVRIEELTISTAALTEPLAPGVWFWRYGVILENGEVIYGKTRAFSIAQNTQEFPYPDLGAVFRRVSYQRPRLFIPSPLLASYRERVRSGDLAYLPASFAKSLDEHVGEDLVPEPPYVQGKGAARGENYAKIFRETRPPMDLMERFGLSYVLTGNKAHGLEAKRRLLHFFSWDAEGSTAYKNNDEPAMWMMMRGVRAYDWTADLFTPSERQIVETAMRVRAAQFYDHLRNRRRFHTNPYESHAGRTLGFLGEVALAFAHEWPEAREWLDYVLTMYWNVYPAWGKEDGGWHEGPGYYAAYMSFALHFVVPLREAAGIDLMDKPFFQNTPYYLLYTNPPYAKISPFGDGENGGSSQGKANVMYYFAGLTQDPYIRWYADEWNVGYPQDALGIVLKDDTLKGKPPLDLPPSKHFPGVGLVSLHSALGDKANDIHFLIHSDPYGAISHAHADQNAFTIEAFGEALAIASGYYPWYGSDHHRLWQWESLSSNTITYDGGIGQIVRSARSKGAITGFGSGRDYDYVVADASAAYKDRLTKCIRKVVHVRPGIFVLFDDLAAPEPVTFEWRLHTLSEMALDPDYQSVTVAQGEARMAVRFFYSDNLDISQTKGFDHPPERGGADQFHLVAATPQKTSTAQILTVLLPYKAGQENDLPQLEWTTSETGQSVELASQEGRHIVAFRTAPGEGRWGVGTLECDGDAFAVHSPSDGGYDAAAVARGTMLVEAPPEGPERTIIGE